MPKTFQAALTKTRGKSTAAPRRGGKIESGVVVAFKAYWQVWVNDADDDTPPAGCWEAQTEPATKQHKNSLNNLRVRRT